MSPGQAAAFVRSYRLPALPVQFLPVRREDGKAAWGKSICDGVQPSGIHFNRPRPYYLSPLIREIRE